MHAEDETYMHNTGAGAASQAQGLDASLAALGMLAQGRVGIHGEGAGRGNAKKPSGPQGVKSQTSHAPAGVAVMARGKSAVKSGEETRDITKCKSLMYDLDRIKHVYIETQHAKMPLKNEKNRSV